MPKKKRLLWQLYPTYLLITLLSVIAATWFASRSLKTFFIEQRASDLEARARLFEPQVIEYLDPVNGDKVDQLSKRAGLRTGTRFTVVLPSGKVIGDSEEDPGKMDNHIDRPEIIKALTDPVGRSTRFSRTIEKNMMYVGIPLRKEGELLGVVRVSVPLTAVDAATSSIQNKIVLWGCLIALLAAGLSLVVSRRLTRPIEEIKRAAESFAHGDFQVRLPASNTTEIGGLSETLTQMATELNDRFHTIMRQRNEMESVLASMVEGVVAVDTDERIINMNQAAARLFASEPDQAKGRSIQEVVRNTALQNFVKEALASDNPVQQEIILVAGEERLLVGHGSVLRDAEGGDIGALIVMNDITHLRRLEKIRREFVANVSHEIKTPITAIKGFVETLKGGAVKDPKDADRFLGIIQKHVDRLEAIIEDLLSLSRIEREDEKEEIPFSETPLKTALETAIQLCEARAAEKGIRIDMACADGLVARINPPLLEQAVVNLLDNAIKYSDAESAVKVEASRQGHEIIIRVRDEGCGIEREHLPRLFERFYRVDKARSRQLGGTGLGLAIVKHIVQAHRGRVTVQSALGKGSTFSIHLPKA